MSDPITTLLTATGGAFLGKFVGPAAEHLGKATWERAQNLLQKAHGLLANVGREPQPIELKLFVPLVQAAVLETEESIADRWAALLANAADPSLHTSVLTAFVDIMRNLSTIDVVLLTAIYHETRLNTPTLPGFPRTVEVWRLPEAKGYTRQQRNLSIANLVRLGLCEYANIDGGSMEVPPPEAILEAEVMHSLFGLEFMKACTPPTT